MKHTWRQWLSKFLGERGRASASSSRRRVRPTLEFLEDRTLPSGVSPFVQSIDSTTPVGPITNAARVSYTVTFNEAVTGVDPTDFKLVLGGTVGTTLTQVTPVSASVYTVTVSGITGNGTLGLNLVDNNSIRDLAGDGLVQPNAPAAFLDQTTFATGSRPFSVALADVNGDGKPDLVVANYGSNSVSVLLGNGDGTFQSQATLATGTHPASVAIADLSGDGKADLVICDYGDNNVSVLLGNGNGTFQGRTTFATGSLPTAVAVADLNGDGKPDLVVANLGSDNLSVLLGNGDGTFQGQTTFATGTTPRSVAVADFNSDNKPDLVVANINSHDVSVLLGNGDGTFQRQTTFATGSLPWSVAVADVNGDGKPDLVVANANVLGTVSVLLGNGDGTFQRQTTFAAGSLPTTVAAVDINGDGKPDLIVTSEGYYNVGVLLGNGDGNLRGNTTFATGSYPTAVAVADISGDGRPDLVVANYNSDTVSVLLNAGNGDFTGQVYAIVPSANPTHFVFGGVPGTATAGNGFSFTVTAEDSSNNTTTAYSGTVHFSSSDSQAVLPADATLANGVGTFSATLETAGSQTVTATDAANTVTGTSSPITVSGAAASHFVVAAPGAMVAGSTLLFTVVAEDQFNNTATGYTGTATFTSTDTNSTTKLSGPNALSSGAGTFSATLTTAGGQTVTATDAANTVTGTSGRIAVSAAAASHFVVTGPSATVAGSNLTFTVVADDQFNNTATGYTGAATLTSTDTNSSARLPSPSVLSSGAGTFSATLTTAGSQTVNANDAANSVAGTSGRITVSAAGASHFVVTAPGATVAGSNLLFTVVAEDQFNNTATGYTGAPTFTSTDTNSLTKVPSPSALSSGAATFSATVTTVGSQTVTATDAANTVTGTSGPIAVSAAAATHFFVTAPGQATTGSGFSFTVTAEDRFNNLATGYTGTTVFTSNHNGATLPAAHTLTAGMGTFIATLNTVGQQNITATDSAANTITGTSNPINVVAGMAAQDHFVIKAPGNATAGSAVVFTLTAENSSNATDTGYSGTVHFTSSDPQASAGNGLPNNATLSHGRGVFSVTLKTAGGQSLTAAGTVSSTISAGTVTIMVSAAAASHFVVAAPATAEAGANVVFTVTAEDRFNNVASSYAGTVVFSSSDNGREPNADDHEHGEQDYGQGQRRAILPAPHTLSSGVGTFSATLTMAASQTLTATDATRKTITGHSGSITVSAAAASHFGVAAPAEAKAGIAFRFTIVPLDPFNNVSSAYAGTVHFTSNDSNASLPADSTLTGGTGTFSATLSNESDKHPGSTLEATDTVNPAIKGTSKPIKVKGRCPHESP